VLSTAAYMRAHDIADWKAAADAWQPDLQDDVDCEGLVLNFLIDETTPPFLDLGKLENRPIPAMRAKARPPRQITAGAPPP
jgi:hypothetical protein